MRASVLSLCAIAIALGSTGGAQARRVPVLVELFTSEGCSSCPPADALLARLIDAQPIAGVEVVGLGQHVDYWDHQGWKDRFASPALTSRQQQYARAFSIEAIYTPQMVVDGRAELVGNDASAARRAIEKAGSTAHGVVGLDVTANGGAVHVDVRAVELPKLWRGDHADVIVAVTESHLTSDVRAGENKGRALSHAAVVRALNSVGEIVDGRSALQTDLPLDSSWRRDRLVIVAFVQERASRKVLASAAARLRGEP